MRNLMLIFVVALAFCATAMASDIAISTQAGWMSQTHADNESQEIVNNVKGVSIQVFTPTQLDALATWVKDHTGDGTADLLIMFGNFPATIYPAGNAQPNGSIAELFLDDGNVIINTGDYIFYVGSNGNNDAGGLQNMMDVSGAAMWGDDTLATLFTPTADGQLYTPSLRTSPSNRPWFPAQFAGTNWEFELVLAQNSNGSQVHPAILHNTVTDGRVGVFFQWNSDAPPRGEVISEWINNWYLKFVAAGNPYPRRPNPQDGAMHGDTWVTLSWTSGDFAVSHDVYLGESFADVNSGAAGTFRGNQALTYYVAGFPGFAYPDGLVPGTTYYWRIDEVNAANAGSPWKGPVWSFSVPPKKAYNPTPADGSKFIGTKDLTLSWTVGFGSKLHTVYFGDNRDTVANAVGGVPQGTTTYKPGVLEAEKTYYWRVDEFEGPATHKGDIWSFTTAKVGGGVKGEYFNNVNLSGPPVLTRTDPQINFYWNPGPVGPGVNEDNFSVRWTGELEAPFSEPFTFIIGCDDGVRMYLNGELIINDWGTGHDYTEFSSQPIDLVAGEFYSIVVEGFELTGEAEWRLFWTSPSLPRDYVPQAALSLPVKASAPQPGNGATGVSLTPVLTWGPGDFAASHEVYFGAAADAVKNATKASPEYKGSKALGAESYNPGKLAWYTTYYWRVDEVNNVRPDSPWVGNVWSFTTGDFLLVDNFESYDAGANQIWYAWHDGLGYGAPGTPPYFAGNGTGAAVGDENTASFTEETIVHGGRKAMPLSYDNNKTGFAKYSEAEFKLTAPRDWTEESVGELSIWFRGLPGSVGSFVEAPAGTFTMTASGTDIWDVGTAGNYRDEFHYAYKTLTGAGSIVARVQSVQNTDGWAKAGVMIRETLEPGSKHAFGCVTPSNGVGSQGRDTTGAASFNTNQTGVAAPRWLKLERDAAGNFTVTHSANGTAWSPVTGATPRNIPMSATVYVGLAVTAHNAALTCQAVFTNVTTTGTVSPQWAHQDIGIASNAAEPLYVAVSNAAGQPAVVVHPDPKAAQITTWTEWVIPLQSLTGITLTNVDKLALGLGTRGNMTTPGGSGKMYFDDIRLYRPRTAP